MPTQAEFIANPLFESFVPPKYPIEIVNEFLFVSDAELSEHKDCMGQMYDRIVFYLTAHRLSEWSANQFSLAEAQPAEVLPVSEIRRIVSSLSVSDEAGSESVSFQPLPSPGPGSSPEAFESTSYGRMYLSLFKRYKCINTWMVI